MTETRVRVVKRLALSLLCHPTVQTHMHARTRARTGLIGAYLHSSMCVSDGHVFAVPSLT